MKLTYWCKQGIYEYQKDLDGYTGWFRKIRGINTDGTWQQWNYKTGKEKR